MKMPWRLLKILYPAVALLFPALAAYSQQTNGPGNAVSLDGTNGYLNIPGGVWCSNNFTIEGWVFARAYNNWSRLIEFGNGAPIDNVYVALSAGTTGKVNFGIYTNTASSQITAPTLLPTNQWVHVAVTLNGTTGAIYVNGVPQVTGTMFVPRNVVRTNNYIGRSDFESGGDARANAIYDEVRIWNVARTQAQIQTSMNHSLAGNETGLIGYWRFDENAGTNATDATGNGQTATLLTGASWTNSTVLLTNAFDYALNFNAPSGQSVTIPTKAALNPYPLTVMCWFKVPTNSAGGAIVNKYTSSSLNGWQLALGSQLFGWYYRDGSDFVGNTGAGAVNDNLWHHGAFVVDAAGGHIYVDGVLKGTNAWTGTPGACTTANNVVLGLYPGDNFYTGQVDEPSVWNVALTAAQIQTYMHQPLVGNETGLVGYYRLNEGIGTNVYDYTAGANTGTFSANPPTWVISGAQMRQAPLVTTLAASVNNNSATLNGTIVPEGQTTGTWFIWGTNGTYGSSTTTNSSGSAYATATNSAVLSNLSAATYHYRAVATNAGGANYGLDQSFTVTAGPPILSNLPVTGLTATNATLNASVNPNGAATTVYFAYGTDTNYGTTDSLGNIGSGSVAANVSDAISNLLAGTVYHWRVTASNSLGVVSGADQTFLTPSAPIVATQAALGLTSTGVTLDALVTPNGATTTVYFAYGTTPDYGNTGEVDNIGSGTNALLITNQLSGLAPSTVYYYQVAASNLAGVTYDNPQTFMTPGPAIATTLTVTNLTSVGAALNGTVNPAGTATMAWFEWGVTAGYGNVTAVTNLPPGSDPVDLSAALNGLAVGANYHYRVVASNSFGVSPGADMMFSTPLFTAVDAGLAPMYFGQAVWGDFDNDGYLDIVTVGQSSVYPISSLWRNQHDGTFSSSTGGLNQMNGFAVAWADIDNDGLLDLAVNGLVNGSAPYANEIWRNMGDGTFSNLQASLPATFFGSLAWGDFDNDGKPDLLVTGMADQPICQVWRNMGDGTFSNINANITGVFYGNAIWADMDGDGRLDIVLTGATVNDSSYGPSVFVTQIWRNMGDGTFSNMNVGPTAVGYATVAAADFDNDGRLDLVLCGMTNDPSHSERSVTEVWRNTGNWGFTKINAGLPGVFLGTVSWGDYDGDGYPDVFVAGFDSQLQALAQLWRNQRDGTFALVNAGTPDFYNHTSVSWGDFDNDGRLDLLVVGSTELGDAVFQIYQNYVSISNTPPTAPTGLSSSPGTNGPTVVLSWNASTDAQTPSAGLSYNIRVGTTPGGIDIVSPNADLTTGRTRQPAIGNAGERLSAAVKLPASGTYYWSVQAVDTGFAGSAFAPEATVTLTIAPTASTGPAMSITSSNAAVSATVNPNGAATAYFFQYGLDTSYGFLSSTNPVGSGSAGVLVSNVIGSFLPGVTIHYRVVATNSAGLSAGGDASFTTMTNPPTAVTLPATSVTGISAVLNAGVNPNGGATTAYFQYGPDTNYGSVTPMTALAAGNVQVAVSNLISVLPGSTNHFSVIAVNDAGTNIGADLFFVTPPIAPTAATLGAGSIDLSKALLSALVNPDGAPVAAWFEYGLTTNYGHVTTPTNLAGVNTGIVFSSLASGLAPATLYHYQVLVTNSFGVFGGGDDVFTSYTFGELSNSLPATGQGGVAWGDFNHDDKLDILLGGESSSGTVPVEVWRNNGGAAFSDISTVFPSIFSGNVAWADFDNDGWLDVLISSAGTGAQIWHNNGDGTFTELSNTGVTGTGLGSVAVGDFDNDGRVDILVTGESLTGNFTTQIWHNNGNGTFTLATNTGLPGLFSSFAAVADYDGDGWLDIFLAGLNSGNRRVSQIWHNNGDGTFSPLPSNLPRLTQGAAAWGDYDNDGMPDLVVTGETDTGPVSQVWRNLGNGNFSTTAVFNLPGVFNSSVSWGDYDNDGRLDILLTGVDVNQNPVCQIWRNLGNGTFSLIDSGLPTYHADRGGLG